MLDSLVVSNNFFVRVTRGQRNTKQIVKLHKEDVYYNISYRNTRRDVRKLCTIKSEQ